MSLLVIAYPTMDARHLAWIQAVRQDYPELKWSVVAPHFTLVFPLQGVEPAALRSHIAQVVATWPAVRFVIRCSILIKDVSSPYTHLLLVPDEGFSALVKLHDRLYTGLLREHLRLEIPFVPHLTIGYAADIALCKRVVDQINAQELEIPGMLHRLTLIRLEGTTVETLGQFELRDSPPTGEGDQGAAEAPQHERAQAPAP
jgi:2'-5' RNA ligase